MKLWKGEPPNEAYYKNAATKARLAVVQRDDPNAMLAHLTQCPVLFVPMAEQ